MVTRRAIDPCPKLRSEVQKIERKIVEVTGSDELIIWVNNYVEKKLKKK